ncbi:hypothetical protein, partial [Cronobacter sakazakii]|uniref:hypothetical protein n=1 Tax=Cronobacter sakazakii TaxID=28141 RepID=UPI001C612312
FFFKRKGGHGFSPLVRGAGRWVKETAPSYCLAASRSGATGRYYRDLHENGQADFFLSLSFG